MFKLIKLCTLGMCSSLHIIYTSIKVLSAVVALSEWRGQAEMGTRDFTGMIEPLSVLIAYIIDY